MELWQEDTWPSRCEFKFSRVMSGHKTWRNIFRFHAQARPDGKSPRRTLTPQSAAYSPMLRAHTSSAHIESQFVDFRAGLGESGYTRNCKRVVAQYVCSMWHGPHFQALRKYFAPRLLNGPHRTCTPYLPVHTSVVMVYFCRRREEHCVASDSIVRSVALCRIWVRCIALAGWGFRT